MDKDKNLPVPREVSRVDIPPNMTTADYHQMNLRPGHRIGLEYKQKHLSALSDLYVEGFLTEEEYDKRVNWVNDAQTSEQVDIAFTDLQRALLKLKVDEYLQPEKKTGQKIPSGIISLFMVISAVFLFGITVEAALGVWLAALILFAEFLGLMLYARNTFKKMM